MYKAESCKICGQSIKLYDCEKCYGLCGTEPEKDQKEKESKPTKEKKCSCK